MVDKIYKPLNIRQTTDAAFNQANSAFAQANTVFTQANTVFAAANSAAQTIPQNAQTSNYVLTQGDAGKHIYVTGSTSTILYIPNNGNTNFTLGTVVRIISGTTSSANISVTPNTSVSLYMVANGTSGTRNVVSKGVAELMHVAANTWYIYGFNGPTTDKSNVSVQNYGS